MRTPSVRNSVLQYLHPAVLENNTAGQRVSELFRRRGVTTIANDIVVDVGLTAVCAGLTVCFLCLAYLVIAVTERALGGTFLVGVYVIFLFSPFLVAFVVATTVEVLRSSFKAVFVCFVQVQCCDKRENTDCCRPIEL